jgi:alpha-amylase
MSHPVHFAFGLHAHQPVGNFGHVFEEHLNDVYRPFLNKAVEGHLFPLTLHLSGPLLDWLEENGPDYLDLIGTLVAEERVELLLSGYYEPILPALLKEDRLDQIRWMQEALFHRFGARARGLWLTERVWEPDLAEDLADAGVSYVLVDDRHFVAAGFSRDQLHLPFRTEFGGKGLGVFAIDEYLRYLLPFRPAEDTATYLRSLREAGHRLAVAADDIEKFGGWPGTREWVYDRGWIDDFIRTMKELEARGEVKLTTFGAALEELPSGGPAYLPSSSYREMEEWTLPPPAYHRLEELKEDLGEERFSRGESPLIRGSHWRNFLVRYPEANRMHKKSIALSRLCRDKGAPPEARRFLGAAQCNDAYWHGVFGGLYLRHIRDTVWRNLANAEGLIRQGEDLSWEESDLDLDGNQELWIRSARFSALVSPARGGAVEEYTFFEPGVNLANTLTRRREAYHVPAEAAEGPGGEGPGSAGEAEHRTENASTTPSIHDLEGTLRFTQLPPIDPDQRALFVERILPAHVGPDDLMAGRFDTIASWADTPLHVLSVEKEDPSASSMGWIEIVLGDPTRGRFEKRLRFASSGYLEVSYSWDSAAFPPGTFFCTELSLGAPAPVTTVPEGVSWRYPISTFSKSERGFDETVQGESMVFLWPVEAGQSQVSIDPS